MQFCANAAFLLMQEDKVDTQLAHLLLVAVVPTTGLQGKSHWAWVTVNGQWRAAQNHGRPQKEWRKCQLNTSTFLSDFEYQSDFEMFCGESVDKGYRVDASFENGV